MAKENKWLLGIDVLFRDLSSEGQVATLADWKRAGMFHLIRAIHEGKDVIIGEYYKTPVIDQ
jgi:hypothetical protein